jgi:hypothetical protein
MADNSNAKPNQDEAIAVSSRKQRFVQVSTSQSNDNKKNVSSLFSRCRAVVVANLDRYPPEILGMLGPDDWADIVRCKHRKTAPQKGKDGLDGTGRRTPCMSERFIAEVEEMNPHLADLSVADRLVWRDCVEFQFSRSGLTRPRAMLLPWPLLVKQVINQAEILVDWQKKEDSSESAFAPLELSELEAKTIIDATQRLRDSPMNVSLLKESGIGKVLKKLVKASSNRTHTTIFKRLKMPASAATSLAASKAGADGRKMELSVLKTLEMLLQAWMDLAASRGIAINSSGGGSAESGTAIMLYQEDSDDLKCLEESGKSWKQLHVLLKGRAEQRRRNLGQKMRANRKKENSMRPQIVKVRPANPRREAILHRAASSPTWAKGGGTVESHGGANILKLRKEAADQAARQKSGATSFKAKGSGFGAAVAFASTTKLSAKQKMIQQQSRKRKIAAVVALGSGKQMAVPSKVMRMQGANFSTKNVIKNKKKSQR